VNEERWRSLPHIDIGNLTVLGLYLLASIAKVGDLHRQHPLARQIHNLQTLGMLALLSMTRWCSPAESRFGSAGANSGLVPEIAFRKAVGLETYFAR
jgi:hypothetical protein